MFEGFLVLEGLLFIDNRGYQPLAQTVVSIDIKGLVFLVGWVWLEKDHLAFDLREGMGQQDVILVQLLDFVVLLDF